MGAHTCGRGASLQPSPPVQKSFARHAQDRMPPFMRDFFPTGKFKNARIAPHNRRPKMAINKRRFSQEATYARRCLRGRSCARGRVVPCPAPQPGKVSGMGMQDRMPPRMRKKFPHQDSTLPTPGQAVCPVPSQEAAAGPRSCQGDRRGHRRRADSVALLPVRRPQQPPRSHRGDHRCHRCRAGLPVLPPTRRPQRAPEAAKETAETSAAGPCLHSPLPGGRSRPQKPPGRPQRPPPPGRLLSMPGGTMSYWNKWYQRTADERIGAVIAHNFLGGNLITLRYANPDRVTDLFVIRNWKAWIDRARISNGGNFKFIVGHDYGTPEAPAMAHYVFIDVAAAECERMASNWVCGPAAVTHLDAHALHDILSALSNRPVMQRKTSRPLWGSSRKVPCTVPPSKTG